MGLEWVVELVVSLLNRNVANFSTAQARWQGHPVWMREPPPRGWEGPDPPGPESGLRISRSQSTKNAFKSPHLMKIVFCVQLMLPLPVLSQA